MLPTHMPWLRLFCVSSAVYETANRRQPSHRDKPVHTPLGRDLFHRFCKENVLDLPFLRKPGFKSNHKLQKQSNGFVYKRRSGPLSKRKNFFFFFPGRWPNKFIHKWFPPVARFPATGRQNSVCTNTEPAMGEVNSQLLLKEIQKSTNAAHLHQT